MSMSGHEDDIAPVEPQGLQAVTKQITEILESPSSSVWLKDALSQALQRDSVDAANDAEVLSDLLGARATALLMAAVAERNAKQQ